MLPRQGSQLFLSLGNIFFPFFNPAFAIGIGLLYWLITWQFQNLVSQYRISSRQDRCPGYRDDAWSVLQFMPLYLVQAMIASISLVAMLGALYATLLWYVDAIERPKIRRYLTKFFVGTTHFLAHLVVMFTLSLLAVSVNNQLAGPIEKALDAIYQTREEQAPIVRDVIQEGLQPLQQRQAEQRDASSAAAGQPSASSRPPRRARARRFHLLSSADDRAGRLVWRLAVGYLLGPHRASSAACTRNRRSPLCALRTTRISCA